MRRLIAFIFLTFLIAPVMGLELSNFKNKWSGDFRHKILRGDGPVSRASIIGNEFPSYIETTFEDGFSFREKFVKVVLRVSDLSKLSGIELRLSSEESGYSDFLAIPIPLFTDPDFNTIQSDSWVTYTFTLGEAVVHGNPNLDKIKRLGFYLGGKGIFIDFKSVEIKEAFPQSIVSFTFDDGYDDHYVAAEIMNKYDFAGTAYLMPRQFNQKNYLNEQQVRDLQDIFGWDLSSHHKIPILEFSSKNLEEEFEYTIDYLSGLGAYREARHFAYPLGKQSRKSTLPIVKRIFDTARIAGGGAETLPPADWHMLRTFNVMPHFSPAELFERVKKAREHGEWLILMFHYLTDEENPVNPLAYNTKKFEEFCQLLKEDETLVLTVNDVFEAFER